MANSRFLPAPNRIKPLFLGLVALSVVVHLGFFLWPKAEKPLRKPDPIEVTLLPLEPPPPLPAVEPEPPVILPEPKPEPKPTPPVLQPEPKPVPAPKPAPKAPAPAKPAPPAAPAPAAPKPVLKPSLNLGSKLPSQAPSQGIQGAPISQPGSASGKTPGSPGPSFEELTQVNPQAGSRMGSGALPKGQPASAANTPGNPSPSQLNLGQGSLKDLPAATNSSPASGKGAIQGEAAARKLIFRPQPPRLSLTKEVTITLEFRVLPSGTVDQIRPLTKGDPQLETLAIELLSQFRFEAIPPQRGAQSGVIHFTLEKGN